MKNLINRALNELSTDQELKSNPLVKILTESMNKSIVANASTEIMYSQLKEGLTSINAHLKNKKIDNILDQFKKGEISVDSEIIKKSKLANLSGILEGIKSSNACTNPIIKQYVDSIEESMKSIPEFMLYPSFIREFSKFSHEKSIKEAVDHVSNVMNKNASDFEVLYTITSMSNMNSQIYENVVSELKEMLAKGEYTSDIINIKLGKSGLPAISNLVNTLKIVESKQSDSFTLGIGNGDTKVSNQLAPSTKSKDGSLMMYADNRFIRVSESKKRIKYETEVHIEADNFRISTLDPNYVKENYSKFYSVCEAYARLGFAKSELNEGVESKAIRNFKIGMYLNETSDLDLYLNDSKIEDISKLNLSEALVMETSDVRSKVEKLLENLGAIYNLDFIKNISNDRMLAEATVYKLKDTYIVCERLNAAERDWKKMDEHQMYEFFMKKFQYDISPIFKTKIDESIEAKKQIEVRKQEITDNIAKLEGSIKKIDEALESNTVRKDAIDKLEEIKESIQKSISDLKEEYISIDLMKKGEVNEKKWIQDAIKRPGATHKMLGKKEGEKITKAELNKKLKSLDKDKKKPGTQAKGKADQRKVKQLNLAKTLKSMNEHSANDRWSENIPNEVKVDGREASATGINQKTAYQTALNTMKLDAKRELIAKYQIDPNKYDIVVTNFDFSKKEIKNPETMDQPYSANLAANLTISITPKVANGPIKKDFEPSFTFRAAGAKPIEDDDINA
jgi:hypothetical protein